MNMGSKHSRVWMWMWMAGRLLVFGKGGAWMGTGGVWYSVKGGTSEEWMVRVVSVVGPSMGWIWVVEHRAEGRGYVPCDYDDGDA